MSDKPELPDVIFVTMQEKFYALMRERPELYNELKRRYREYEQAKRQFDDLNQNIREIARFLDEHVEGMGYTEMADNIEAQEKGAAA